MCSSSDQHPGDQGWRCQRHLGLSILDHLDAGHWNCTLKSPSQIFTWRLSGASWPLPATKQMQSCPGIHRLEDGGISLVFGQRIWRSHSQTSSGRDIFSTCTTTRDLFKYGSGPSQTQAETKTLVQWRWSMWRKQLLAAAPTLFQLWCSLSLGDSVKPLWWVKFEVRLKFAHDFEAEFWSRLLCGWGLVKISERSCDVT